MNSIHEIRKYMWYNAVVPVGKDKTVACDHGTFTFSASVDCPLSRSLYVYHEFGYEYLEAALEFSRHYTGRPAGTGTMLDIGGNIGTSCIQALCAGLIGKAVAVEPDRDCYGYLLRNIRQNNLTDRVFTLNMAVSAEKTTVTMKRNNANKANSKVMRDDEPPADASGAECEYFSVQADTLDTILRSVPADYTDDLCVGWIDVEGHEARLFSGGKETFAKDIPIISEVCPSLMLEGGIDLDFYAEICKELWTYFWIYRQGTFQKQSIANLNDYLAWLHRNETHEDIVLTKRDC